MATTESSDSQNKDRLTNFLKAIHCISPVFPNDFSAVVRVRADATVAECFKILIDNRILSVPVVDPKTNKPLYIISLMDIVAQLIKLLDESSIKKDFVHWITNWLSNKSSKVAHMPLTEFEKTLDSTLDPVYTVMDNQSIYEAVKLMIEKKSHRILVYDSKFNLSNVITQSRVMQFVNVVINDLPKGKKTLKELNLGLKEVFSISEKEIAYTAFKMMIEKKVSALAVVNDKGRLEGNISVADIKAVGYNLAFWDLMSLPLKEYLQELVTRKVTKLQVFDAPIFIKVKATDTLAYTVHWICMNNVHRAYIVDDNFKPIGVVALYDILKEIVE
jgi:CBS domain-containing protein